MFTFTFTFYCFEALLEFHKLFEILGNIQQIRIKSIEKCAKSVSMIRQLMPTQQLLLG